MGCHTWHWKRLDVTNEQAHRLAREAVEKMRTKTRDFLVKQLARGDESCSLEEWDAYCEQSSQAVEAGDWPQVAELATSVLPGNCREHRGVFYQDISRRYGQPAEEYAEHDSFRVGHYPNKRLFSLKQTLKYIQALKRTGCYVGIWQDNDPVAYHEPYPGTHKRLREFWSRYPDGMITFG